jgi:putative Mg2+ transporter-C (MgtC) family protein
MDDIGAQLQGLISIIIAAALAALPGLDRERRQRPAGLRTHMLVAVSTTMFTVMSRLIFSEINPDSSARLVANIPTGIGFLGGGIILHRKDYVHDVTTAASIWMVALLGIVVGYELYALAIGSTAILMVILVVIRRFEDKEIYHPAERMAKGLAPHKSSKSKSKPESPPPPQPQEPQ